MCSYLKINTIFGVAKAHGLITAWSDKASGYIVRTLPKSSFLNLLDMLAALSEQCPSADAPALAWL